MPYTSVPNTGDTLGGTRDAIRNNFGFIDTTIDVDHNSMNEANTGHHKQIHITANQAAPGLGGATSVLYGDSVNGASALALQNALGSFALTGLNPANAQNGHTTLPGSLILQWGSLNISANGTTTVPFNTNYINPLTFTPIVLVGIVRDSSSSENVYVKPGTVLFNQFNVRNNTSAQTLNWIAIGPSPA